MIIISLSFHHHDLKLRGKITVHNTVFIMIYIYSFLSLLMHPEVGVTFMTKRVTDPVPMSSKSENNSKY